MDRVEQLEAELAVARLERDFPAAKKDLDGEDLQRKKVELREARRVFREMRAAAPPEESLGDATVRPAPIKAKAGVKSPGGKG